MFNEKYVFNFTNLTSRDEIFNNIATNLLQQKIITDSDELVNALLERESLSSTGFENGIAIPHAKINGIKSPIVVVCDTDIESWPSMDGNNTTLVFCIIVPATSSDEHLAILSKLSAKLIDNTFVQSLKTADPQEKIALLSEIKSETKIEQVNKTNDALNYIAVTGCPTGIAHTFMAAENLTKTAGELGHNIKVETRGQNGVDNRLTESDIENADGVIITADVDVDINRFVGKKVISKPVKEGVKDVSHLFTEVLTVTEMKGNKKASNEQASDSLPSLYASLMNGVTHMLPFTIAGGIFTALRFFFGTEADIEAGVQPVIEMLSVGEFFSTLGGALMGVMIPILAAYIAQSIGKRPGLMLGFLAGSLALVNGSGFLGAIIGGFLAGYIAHYLVSYSTKINKNIKGIYSILVIPVCGALLIGLFMLVFGVPIAWLNNLLTSSLESLQNFSPIILGAIIGIMMAADMGGPINKAAYVTGTLLLSEGNETFMAAVMAGGMVPPIAIFISAVLKPKLYPNQEERGAAYSNIIMGASFITEGAIPFAAKNPARVIPPLMIGAGIGGALTMLFNITLPAPHGGIFVFPLVNNPLLYALAIIIGSIVGGILLIVFQTNKSEDK